MLLTGHLATKHLDIIS